MLIIEPAQRMDPMQYLAISAPSGAESRITGDVPRCLGRADYQPMRGEWMNS